MIPPEAENLYSNTKLQSSFRRLQPISPPLITSHPPLVTPSGFPQHLLRRPDTMVLRVSFIRFTACLLCVSFVSSSAFVPPTPPISQIPRVRNPSSLSTLKAQFDVFFDIAIRDKAAGRMVFQVSEDHLPKAVENFKTLVTGERGALDSTLNYKNCAFEFSSMYTMGAQYKWSHVCKGRGKNVFGNGKDAIKEPEAMAACRHPCPGICLRARGMCCLVLTHLPGSAG
eukprot:3870227-Rhodomonas_salina.2